MNKKLATAILSVVVIIVIFNFNKAMGWVLLVAALLFLLYKNLPNIYMLRAARKYVNKNLSGALSLYEKAYKFKHSSPAVKINYAYMLLRQGEVLKAEKILRDLMEKPLNSKDKVSAVLNLSLVLWKKDNLTEAIKLLQELYDSGYKTTVLYQNLGFFYILNGDLEKSLEFNKEAYEYNDTDPSILDNLALNYYLMKDYDKALETYEKLIPMNPSFVSAYYYYGLTLEKKDCYDKALEMLEKALTCPFSYLSAVKKEDVEGEIAKIKNSK